MFPSNIVSHPVNHALLSRNVAGRQVTAAKIQPDFAMPPVSFSRAVNGFACPFFARARSLGSHAMLIGAKRAPVRNWRTTSGGGRGVLVARRLRFAEDRGCATVAAADLRDFALALQASEDHGDFGLLERTSFPSEEGVDIL